MHPSPKYFAKLLDGCEAKYDKRSLVGISGGDVFREERVNRHCISVTDSKQRETKSSGE